MTTPRRLLVILAALGAVAVFSGVTGILLGPGFAPGGTEVAATVDSNFRFAYVFWLAAGLILWWTLRRPRERARETRLVLALAFGGGIARLVSIFAVGWPHPMFIGALGLELVGIPLVLWWHLRAVRPLPAPVAAG